MMDWIRRASELEVGGRLTPEAVETLRADADLSVDELLEGLIALAKTRAAAPVSGFEVGAVAEGNSGAVYFGANLEIPGLPLSGTIHAEQAAVIQAVSRWEPGLRRLAVSAPPCGHCRQFLYELSAADRLEILVPGRRTAALAEFLPEAFGPADLGVETGFPVSRTSGHEWVVPPSGERQVLNAAFDAASVAYAPYTGALAGAAIRIRSDEVFAGPYLENAAFNPSVSPFLAALVCLTLSGSGTEEIEEVVIAQLADSKIDHAAATRPVLNAIAPGAALEMIAIHPRGG